VNAKRQEAARKALAQIKAQPVDPALEVPKTPAPGKPVIVQNRNIRNTEYGVVRKDKDFLYYPRRRSYKTTFD